MNNKPAFTLNVCIAIKNDKPAVKLSRITTEEDIIKSIISCALHNRPIVVLPQFSDILQSMNSLIEKGIVYKENDRYFWVED